MALGIWNQFDEVALYLGMSRLDSETDSELYNRIRKFAKWKYKTDYNTQVHSIPLQVGLETYPVATITCIHRFTCKLDWEYFTLETFPEDGSSPDYIRVFININDSPLDKISKALENIDSVTFSYTDSSYVNLHQKFLVRGSNEKHANDFVGSSDYTFEHKNLVNGSVRFEDKFNFRTAQPSLKDVVKSGDYFVDHKTGYVHAYNDVSSSGSVVSYKYYQPIFTLEGTEFNMIPLSVLTKYGLTDDITGLLPSILNGKMWGK